MKINLREEDRSKAVSLDSLSGKNYCLIAGARYITGMLNDKELEQYKKHLTECDFCKHKLQKAREEALDEPFRTPTEEEVPESELGIYEKQNEDEDDY